MAKTKIGFFLMVCILVLCGAFSPGRSDGLRNCVQESYRSQIGVREATGHNDGAQVEAYQATTHNHRGDSWCGSFVNWNYIHCGVPTNNSGWAAAWFPSSKTIYTRGGKFKQQPQHADVGGIYDQRQGRIHHVFFIDEVNEKSYTTCEGNTNNNGSANGDGVYKRYRPKWSVYKIASWVPG